MKKLFRSLLCLILTLCLLPVPTLALEVDMAKKLLDVYYIDDLPQEALDAQTLDELFAALGDPYTLYLTAEEHEQLLTGIEDTQVVGIGVSVQDQELGATIVYVVDGTPAHKAGLVAGDIIIKVNGVSVKTIDEATALITGPEGSEVTITVLRADGSIADFTMKRQLITIATTAQHTLSEDGNAGVILCTSFGDTTSDHFAEALLALDDSVNGWIVDLTANPGGTDIASASTAGCFVGAGDMVYFRDGQGQYSYIYTTSLARDLTDKPAILLTSSYSASGAELFAAAIRDHGAGIAMGQRTIGKGVAQVLLTQDLFPDLFDGDALKVTSYRFFSPAGITNNQIGVFPTLPISIDYVYPAALLLCADPPQNTAGHLKLTLAGWDFYIDLSAALSESNRPAFGALLSSLTPGTQLWQDDGAGQWMPVAPEEIAHEWRLPNYHLYTFSDLFGCVQSNAIRTLATYGLVSGDGTGAFLPNRSLTRAELCAMVSNLLNLNAEPVTQSQFHDVPADAWYAPAIHAVHDLGLVSELIDGFFHPNQTVTQQELVSLLADLSKWANMHAYEKDRQAPADEDLLPYGHLPYSLQKDAWILESIGFDLSGLDYESEATRGVAADLIYRFMKANGLLWQ